MCPLTFINPLALVFNSDAVALALRPCPLIGVPTGPGIDAHHLEAVAPRARVLALALGSRADAVAVGLSLFPPSTV